MRICPEQPIKSLRLFVDGHPLPSELARKSFDSGAIQPGMSWKYVVKKKGSYSYICVYHPTMKAELIVQ